MEFPERKEKIVKVTYEDGSVVDVVFTKMAEPVTMEKLGSIPREEAPNYCLEVPINKRTYDVNDEIKCMQDCEIILRDGVKIYADIYLPKNIEKVPLIISWSFFSKRPWEQPVQRMRPMGVPTGTVSEVCKFESSDPMYWCRNGYGVANVDPRGIGNSEGDLHLFGRQDGRDGYDFVEWAALQPWCTGKVSLFGNSGVAMTQWRIAAECPPHLTCIAPWEGTGDIYRESVLEGGMMGTFSPFIVYGTTGKGYIDNMIAMAAREPFVTSPYWQDKIPVFENIKIPVYATVNWNHFHLRGTWEGFNKIKSQKKWMRTHLEFEWPDTYNPKNLLDLKLFYDRYLKDIYNGWELTPRIRNEVMDVYNYSYQIDRAENKFPLERTVYKNLYLDSTNGLMCEEEVKIESETCYDAQIGEVNFSYTFNEETELTGYMKLRLFVEARGHDDMCIFVNVKKDSTLGEELPIKVLETENHPGAWGKLRVSRRHLDEKESTEFKPVYAMDREEKLKPGEIVPIDIEIYPLSRIWHKGQKLRIQLAGRYIRDESWFEPLGWITDNIGQHVIHTGVKYKSYLVIPVVPPKFSDGDFVIR